jgi:predicted transcriptional regulator
MANTPVRHIRIPDSEWEALQAAAKATDRTSTDVIREAIRKYVTRHAQLR